MGIAPLTWRRKHKAKTTMLCRAAGQGGVVSRLEAGTCLTLSWGYTYTFKFSKCP